MGANTNTDNMDPKITDADANDGIIVLDIGGTTTRAARMNGRRVEKIVQGPTPTTLVSPDASIEMLQVQLIELAHELVGTVSHHGDGRTSLPVAISFPGRLSEDNRTVLAAPDLWGAAHAPFPLALRFEERALEGRSSTAVVVRMCSDMEALVAQYASQLEHQDRTFALLAVRTGVMYAIGDPTPGRRPVEPVLLGHKPIDAPARNHMCTCGTLNHVAAVASSVGAANVLVGAALQEPKAFRSSLLFRLASERYGKSRFEQRLATFRRPAVRRNAHEFDEDVWRNMHDKHAEVTPGEMQRWVLPAVLDSGMFIEAVRADDAWALELLDTVTQPVAVHLRDEVLPRVDVVALTGGFARALGNAYLTRIAPDDTPDVVQWASGDVHDDLRAVHALLYPTEVIDLREPVLTA